LCLSDLEPRAEIDDGRGIAGVASRRRAFTRCLRVGARKREEGEDRGERKGLHATIIGVKPDGS
jgi:hypothetical protein